MVILVEIDDDKWFYLSCKKCSKKVLPDDGAFYCEKCEIHVKDVVPWYTISFIFYIIKIRM